MFQIHSANICFLYLIRTRIFKYFYHTLLEALFHENIVAFIFVKGTILS